MRFAKVSILALCLVSPAAAAELPRFDVASHCKTVAAFGGSFSASLNESCMDMEQAAYNQLKPVWSGLDLNMQNHCKQIATFSDAGSYSLLQSCIEMETTSANRTKDRQFQY